VCTSKALALLPLELVGSGNSWAQWVLVTTDDSKTTRARERKNFRILVFPGGTFIVVTLYVLRIHSSTYANEWHSMSAHFSFGFVHPSKTNTSFSILCFIKRSTHLNLLIK
jgi:hypothetical protein